MQEIQAWFKNSDYYEGVALYDKYGQNSFLKKLFASGPSDYNNKKLREELDSLNSNNSDTSSENSNQIPIVSAKKSDYSENSDRIPSPKAHQYYLDLLKKRDQLLKQLERCMSLLDISKSSNILFETAKQILSLHNQKVRVWEQIDYYDDHGRFSEPIALKQVKTDELQRLYVQISKAEKRLKSDKVKNPDKTKKLLEAKRAQLEALKQERAML